MNQPATDATATEVVTAEKPSMRASQGEMPFAIVQGEPFTTLPEDLYIPPDALEVILEAFEGPAGFASVFN